MKEQSSAAHCSLSEVSHAEYDAGLLAASMAASAAISLEQEKVWGDNVVLCNPWELPWYLQPRTEVTRTLADYRAHLVSALENVLWRSDSNGRSLFRNKPVSGCQKVVAHLAHSLLLHSLKLHCRVSAGGAPYTVEHMMAGVRDTLLALASERERSMICESPAHPYWGKFAAGTMEMYKPGAERDGDIEVAYWAISINKQEKEFAKMLAGGKGEHPLSIPIASIARQAEERLFAVDDSDILDTFVEERQTLRRLLRGLKVFTPESREEVINTLVDIWCEMQPEAVDEMERLVGETNTASLLDGRDLRKDLETYVLPFIRSGDAEALRQRLVILEWLLVRFAHDEMENPKEHWPELVEAWRATELHVPAGRESFYVAVHAAQACAGDIEPSFLCQWTGDDYRARPASEVMACAH